VTTVWAGFLLSSRLSQAQAFTAWDVLMLRHAGAFLTVLPIVALRGWPRIRPWRAVLLALFAGYGFPAMAYAGAQLAPAAHMGVMLPGILPFTTAALWWLVYGERWTRRRVWSLAVVGAGVLLVAFDTFGAHPGAWRGDLMFLAGSLSWGIYMVLVRRWQVPALDATLAIALVAGPVTLPLWWLLLPSNLGEVSTGAVLYQFAYQGAVAVVAAGFLFTRAMNAIGAPATTTITAIVPALTALAAWPLLGEPLGLAGLAGVALVTTGMVVGVAGSR
jgi:drug/metabolite transporter (DMT)-like permease